MKGKRLRVGLEPSQSNDLAFSHLFFRGNFDGGRERSVSERLIGRLHFTPQIIEADKITALVMIDGN